MTYNCIWILYLILPQAIVVSHPVENRSGLTFGNARLPHEQSDGNYDDSSPKNPYHNKQQIISVRITSSVAVARGNPKNDYRHIKHIPPHINQGFFYSGEPDMPENIFHSPENFTNSHSELLVSRENSEDLDNFTDFTNHNTPPYLMGANIEYIKQLNLKKDNKNIVKEEQIHPYQRNFYNKSSDIDDSMAESSMKTETELTNLEEGIPLARSLMFSKNSKNYVLPETTQNNYDRGNYTRLSTVHFNVFHKNIENSNYEHNTPNINKQVNAQQHYDSLPKVYSEPSRVYSEPAKYYSEPAKIYSEPAKVYSEPAKVYSEPAKIYSEPAKFYSQPASLFLPPEPWHQTTQSSLLNKIITTTPLTTIPLDETTNTAETLQTSSDYGQEENYEVDEEVSVMTNGRAHGVQETSTERCKQSNCKVGYVVEGSEYKKYRVESKTSEGFIVGEYGVVRNEDGALRGVRYTANSDVNPRLIHDGLMKFLQLQ